MEMATVIPMQGNNMTSRISGMRALFSAAILLLPGCGTSGDSAIAVERGGVGSPRVAEVGDADSPDRMPKRTEGEATPGAAAAANEAAVREETYENGRPRVREEGYLNEEGEFVRNGMRTTWYENGQKQSETAYVDGAKEGPERTWYRGGQQWGEGGYKNGKADGTWIVWHRNGFKAKEWRIEEGVWNGPYRTWHLNGEPRMERIYVSGRMQGPFTVWDEEGNVVNTGTFVDDVVQPN